MSMALTFRKLHPHFVSEVGPIDLRHVHDSDWPVPEGRLLLRDLIEHATRPEFVYRHAWRVRDLVIWDNRATMHRALPFDDTKYRRELRRMTTLDIAGPSLVAGGS